MERTTPIAALAVVAIFSFAAFADSLPPGASQDKPGEGLSAPYYSTSLPDYFVPANEVTSVTESMVSFTGDITGTLTSTVYEDPSTLQLTFEYRFANTGASDLVAAAFAPAPWVGVTITGAGSDGAGASVGGTVSPDWTDGDPIFISRDRTSYPLFQWEAFGQGTALIGPSTGDSADIWLSTDATSYQVSYTGLSDGGAISKVALLAPGVIPEPASILAGLQGLGLLLVCRKKFKKLILG